MAKLNADDLQNTLSFIHTLEAPGFADDAREGAWLVVSECVTYLLYPFVTCGAHPRLDNGNLHFQHQPKNSRRLWTHLTSPDGCMMVPP